MRGNPTKLISWLFLGTNKFLLGDIFIYQERINEKDLLHKK